MIAKLKDIATGANGPPADTSSAEQPITKQQANIPSSLSPIDASGRKLRNGLILANIVGWILIVVLIKLIFF
jgi:hypothetical protein